MIKIHRKTRFFNFKTFIKTYNFFKILGLCPVTVKYSDTKNHVEFVDSFLGTMITIQITIINTIFQTLLMSLSSDVTETIVTDVSFYSFASILVIDILGVLLIGIKIISSKKTFKEASNKLVNLHYEIQNLNSKLKQQPTTYFYFTLWILFYIIMFIFNFYSSFPAGPQNTLLDKVYLNQFWIAFTWEIFYIMQYAILVKQIHYEFQDLNYGLNQINVLEPDTLYKIEKRQRLHVNLCEVVRLFSEFYSAPVVACLASFLIANTFNVYSISREITKGEDGSVRLVLQYCLFFAAQILPVSVLTKSVTDTQKEVFMIIHFFLL